MTHPGRPTEGTRHRDRGKDDLPSRPWRSVSSPVTCSISRARHRSTRAGRAGWGTRSRSKRGTRRPAIARSTRSRPRRPCCGDLGRVKRVVKVLGMVNAAPGFPDTPAVVHGASELYFAVFGEAGVHARSAVGLQALPSRCRRSRWKRSSRSSNGTGPERVFRPRSCCYACVFRLLEGDHARLHCDLARPGNRKLRQCLPRS